MAPNADAPQRLVFRVHAVQRMFERGISFDEVHSIVMHDETIERYADDTPYPSRLILGWRAGRPLHAVVADNHAAQEIIVVTVYEPDLVRWHDDFRRRRR